MSVQSKSYNFNEIEKFWQKKWAENKTFKVSNKLKGKRYDPVTTSDKAFEKFIRNEIKKKFPAHQVIGEEFGHKKTKRMILRKLKCSTKKNSLHFWGYIFDIFEN